MSYSDAYKIAQTRLAEMDKWTNGCAMYIDEKLGVFIVDTVVGSTEHYLMC